MLDVETEQPPVRATPRTAGTRPPAPAAPRAARSGRLRDRAVTAVSALVFAGVAFGARGGDVLDRTTIVEIALVLGAGALGAFAVMRARAGRLDGGLTVAGFAALAILTALSIIWSIVPSLSWGEANRTLAYLAVFAAAVVWARLAPRDYPLLLRGLLLATFAIIAYALASRVWPATIAPNEVYARLGEPYGYWNALGTSAALAVPPALWLASRRTGKPAANALAYPLLSMLVLALFLSYSRGAMIVAGVGALAWLLIVPLRLRSLTALALALAGAAPAIVWALSKDAFTRNDAPLAVREAVATQFGLFVLATLVVMLAVGLVVGFRVGSRAPSFRVRLTYGLTATLVACAIPVALVAVLASSDRGLTGTVKADYQSFTSADSNTPGGPSRLLTASSSRGRYWHQAKMIYEANEVHGSGAGTFGVARLRYRRDQLESLHAHGYVAQTMSDFGLIGLGVSLFLLVAWLIAAARATAIPSRRRGVHPWGPERVALAALVLAAVVYGLHSAVDWIWFVPGPTVMALAAAGFVVGRGRLRLPRPFAAAGAPPADAPWRSEPLPVPPPPPPPPPSATGATASPPPADAPWRPPPPPPPAASSTGAASAPPADAPWRPPPPPPPAASSTGAASAPPADAPWRPPPPPAPAASWTGAASAPPGDAPWRPPAPPIDGASADTAVIEAPRRRRGRLLRLRVPARVRPAVRPALAVLVALAALVCAWAIWQPLRSDDASNSALSSSARGHYRQALSAVADARSENPLSAKPLEVRASIEQARGNTIAAETDLEHAVAEFRGDPQTWLELAEFQLGPANRTTDALQTVRGALFLDPESREAQNVFFEARSRLAAAVPPG